MQVVLVRQKRDGQSQGQDSSKRAAWTPGATISKALSVFRAAPSVYWCGAFYDTGPLALAMNSSALAPQQLGSLSPTDCKGATALPSNAGLWCRLTGCCAGLGDALNARSHET